MTNIVFFSFRASSDSLSLPPYSESVEILEVRNCGLKRHNYRMRRAIRLFTYIAEDGSRRSTCLCMPPCLWRSTPSSSLDESSGFRPCAKKTTMMMVISLRVRFDMPQRSRLRHKVCKCDVENSTTNYRACLRFTASIVCSRYLNIFHIFFKVG